MMKLYPIYPVEAGSYIWDGFDRSKLKGMDKLMISMLTKGLASQKQRSDQDERMLELLSKDANYVSTEHLAGILQWYISVYKMGDSDVL